MMRRGSEAAGEPPGFKYECISTVLALLFAIGIIAASIVAGIANVPPAQQTWSAYTDDSNRAVYSHTAMIHGLVAVLCVCFAISSAAPKARFLAKITFIAACWCSAFSSLTATGHAFVTSELLTMRFAFNDCIVLIGITATLNNDMLMTLLVCATQIAAYALISSYGGDPLSVSCAPDVGPSGASCNALGYIDPTLTLNQTDSHVYYFLVAQILFVRIGFVISAVYGRRRKAPDGKGPMLFTVIVLLIISGALIVPVEAVLWRTVTGPYAVAIFNATEMAQISVLPLFIIFVEALMWEDEQRESMKSMLQQQQIDALKAEMASQQKFIRYVFHECRQPAQAISLGMAELECSVAQMARALMQQQQQQQIDSLVLHPPQWQETDETTAINTIFRIIRQSIGDMIHVMESTLWLEKMAAGGYVIELVPTNISEILERVGLSFKGIAEQRAVKLTLAVEGNRALPLVCDSQKVAQVLTNFVSNAIKFTLCGGAGTVDVRVSVVESPPPVAPRGDSPAPPAPPAPPALSCSSSRSDRFTLQALARLLTRRGGYQEQLPAAAVAQQQQHSLRERIVSSPQQDQQQSAVDVRGTRERNVQSADSFAREHQLPAEFHHSRDVLGTKFNISIPEQVASPLDGASDEWVHVTGEDAADGANSSSGSRKTSAIPSLTMVGWLRCEVTDNGCGISAADQRNLFQSFVQIKAGERQKGGGTGLGLHICKEIITRHGGTVGVHSEEGKGSTFFFEIPFLELQQQPQKHRMGKREFSTSGTTSALAGHSSSSLTLICNDPNTTLLDDSKALLPSIERGSCNCPFYTDPHSGQIQMSRGFSRQHSTASVVPTSAVTTPCVTATATSPPVAVIQRSTSTAESSPPVMLPPTATPHTAPGGGEHGDVELDLGDGSVAVTVAESTTQPPRAPVAARLTIASPAAGVAAALPIVVRSESTSPAPASPRSTPFHLLVVDDAPSNRLLLVRQLRRALPPGTIVSQAMDGLEAVALVAQYRLSGIDAITMDGSMPVMDGYIATQLIRSMGFKGPIMGVTGNMLSEDKEKFFAAGATALFGKPTNIDKLVAIVTKAPGVDGSAR